MVCRMFETSWYWLPYAAFGCRKNSFHRNQASVFRCKNSLIFWRPQCKAFIEILAFKVPSVCSIMVCRMFETWWYWLPNAAFGCRKKSFHRNQASMFRCKNSRFFGDREVKLWMRFWRKKLAEIEWKSSKILAWAWIIDWEFLVTHERKNEGRNYAMRRWSETCEHKEVSVNNTYRKMW